MSVRKHRIGCLLLAAVVPAISSCASGGHFTLFGYSTLPNYRSDVRTVRVPIFKNITYRDSVREGLEYHLTRAVIREIQLKTPYLVVGAGCDADTELTGVLVSLTKTVINRNQLNEVREAETRLGVEVVWKDLRSGEILSRPAPSGPPVEGAPPPPAPPVIVFSEASFIPELGESPATAFQRNVDRLAVRIVSMMEKPW